MVYRRLGQEASHGTGTEPKRNPDNESGDSGSGSESDDDGENVEKWWGFWEPEEIKRLVGWIAGNCGLEQEQDDSSQAVSSLELSSAKASSFAGDDNAAHVVGGPTKDELRTLVKGLGEYAGVLEWRVKRQDDDLDAA